MGKRRTVKVVYVSYDGMTDPLGQSQVLPYLRRLVQLGHTFELISFEKPGRKQVVFRERLEPGIRWTALRYHKTPTVPATAFDMTQGGLAGALSSIWIGADLVHVRSYVAATMALPLAVFGRRPLLFDMRGLWPEERVEDGVWSSESRVYLAAKRIEQTLVKRASAITVLTNAMQRYLRNDAQFEDRIGGSIHVIPTCTDLDTFTVDGPRPADLVRQLAGHWVLGYQGSFGGRYLSRPMAEYYLKWREQLSPARFLVVSRQEPEEIRAVLEEAGVADELIHRRAQREEMPGYLRCMHAGMFFHPATPTSAGVAPTKVGELLACGVPVIGTQVGDATQMLTDTRAGGVLPDLSPASMQTSVSKVKAYVGQSQTKADTRTLAETWFSLDRAARAYGAVYEGLVQRNPPTRDTAWPNGG